MDSLTSRSRRSFDVSNITPSKSPRLESPEAVSLGISLGFNDWDTIVRNPMRHVAFYKAVQEHQVRFTVNTELELKLCSSFETSEFQKAVVCIEEVVDQIATALHHTLVYEYNSCEKTVVIGRDEPHISPDWKLFCGPEKDACYLRLIFSSRSSPLWNGNRLNCLFVLSGKKDVLIEWGKMLTSSLQAYRSPDETEDPSRILTQQVFWNRSKETVIRFDHVHSYPNWEEQQSNYPADVQTQVEELLQDPLGTERGRIIILHGPTGGGKTWFLRTLFREWRDTYLPLIIQDVEEFMSSELYFISLMQEVAQLTESAKCHPLIVLEDAGQGLLRTGDYGVIPIQRLLNRSDGLCSGDKGTTFVITFNEDMGSIDPAVVREGRCRAKINFTALSCEEAQAWMHHKERPDLAAQITSSKMISELYGMLRHDMKRNEKTSNARPVFGLSQR